MPAVPSNTPRTRIGRDSAEADRERLLSVDPDSADYRYREDDDGSTPLGVGVGGPQIATFSTDHANGATRVDEENGIKPEGRPGDTWAGNLAFIGVAMLVIPTWVAVLSDNPIGYGWFAFHPPMQTLALCFFTYGIMTLQPTCQPKTKAAGFIRHQTTVFYVGFPLIAFGTLAATLYKISQGRAHVQTWHATFGLICILWVLVQIFLGAGSVWNGGSLFGGGMKAKAIWKYHRMSGYVLFTLMLLTAHLGGGWSTWGENKTSNIIRLCAYSIAPAAILISVWSRIRPSKMKFW